MIDRLKNIEKILPDLLQTPDIWNTLDVNYHPPRVERLWTQLGKDRIMLHIIYPCTTEQALYHPHPWASAIHILDGEYEMGLGVKAPGFMGASEALKGKNSEIYEICKLTLTAGSYYEMLKKKGWHYVRPIDKPCTSVMLIGEPWGNEEEKDQPVPKEKLKKMPKKRKLEIIKHFQGFFV